MQKDRALGWANAYIREKKEVNVDSVYTILTSLQGYDADGGGLILRTTPLSVPDSDGEQVALEFLQLVHYQYLSLYPSTQEGRVGVGGSCELRVCLGPGTAWDSIHWSPLRAIAYSHNIWERNNIWTLNCSMKVKQDYVNVWT